MRLSVGLASPPVGFGQGDAGSPTSSVWHVAVDLGTNLALKNAVLRARAAAEADGSLHPLPGESLPTTPEFREAVKTIVADGTYGRCVDAIIAAEPDVA